MTLTKDDLYGYENLLEAVKNTGLGQWLFIYSTVEKYFNTLTITTDLLV